MGNVEIKKWPFQEESIKGISNKEQFVNYPRRKLE